MNKQNKPDWNEVIGDWLCQNPDGQWVSFYQKPQPDKIRDMGNSDIHYWSAERGHANTYSFGEVIGDWKETLEKRPSQEENSKESEKYFEVVTQYTMRGKDGKQVEIVVINTNDITQQEELNRFERVIESKLGVPTLVVNIGE